MSAVTRTRKLIAGLMIVAMGTFSVMATIDSFVAYEAVLEYAEDTLADGVDPQNFDGGAPWSALEFGLTDDTPLYIQERGGPFWMQFYAVTSYPSIGVALEPLDGYRVLDMREYDSLLHLQPVFLYIIEPEPGLPYFFRVEDF